MQHPVYFKDCRLYSNRWLSKLNTYMCTGRSHETKSVSHTVHEAGSLKMNTALEYSTRVVQEGGRRCKKSTLNDLVHLTPL
jgi:hypothetical protein